MAGALVRTLAAGFLAAAVTGCGAGDRAPGAPTLDVTVRDFHIGAPATVRPGELRLAVHNQGPDTHEVLVVRADGPDLPLRRDGITVDEEALEASHREAGEVEGTQPGHTGHGDFDLSPGRYELICNMAGHYRGGMHTTLVVR